MEDYNQKNTEREPNTFTIYQLKDGEALHYHRFEPLERLEKSGLSVEPDNYSQVYTAPLPEGGSAQDKLSSLTSATRRILRGTAFPCPTSWYSMKMAGTRPTM